MNQLNNFSTIFLSIILEGFPFIIIGALVSSIIQVFVSEEIIRRLIPRNKFFGLICMGIIGLIFPVCECAIIPIARRLIKKGVPLNMAVTFMLSVPIINPIVLMSTYYAFLEQPMMVFVRAGLGVTAAIIIGFLIGELSQGNPLKTNLHSNEHESCCGHHHEHQHEHQQCSCGHHHGHEERNIIRQVLGHTSEELYDIGKLFVIGAALSSGMQTFIPRDYITSIGSGTLSSILVMMLLAFILSICSETDAFIGRTFASQFTAGSIVGFLIFGPMIDVKNTLVLAGTFNAKVVAKLLFLIFSVCFIAAVLSNFIPGFVL
jgi:uncharacterized protein